MTIRTFGMNSREFYEAVCEPRERPWIPNGALPREPRWPRGGSGVWVSGAQPVRGTGEHCLTETDDAAAEAFGEWLRHVEAGRIGKFAK